MAKGLPKCSRCGLTSSVRCFRLPSGMCRLSCQSCGHAAYRYFASRCAHPCPEPPKAERHNNQCANCRLAVNNRPCLHFFSGRFKCPRFIAGPPLRKGEVIIRTVSIAERRSTNAH